MSTVTTSHQEHQTPEKASSILLTPTKGAQNASHGGGRGESASTVPLLRPSKQARTNFRDSSILAFCGACVEPGAVAAEMARSRSGPASVPRHMAGPRAGPPPTDRPAGAARRWADWTGRGRRQSGEAPEQRAPPTGRQTALTCSLGT